MKTNTVLVMRHGEKGKGDALTATLTAKGAEQIFAACVGIAKAMAEQGGKVSRLLYSGLLRTWQSVMIAGAALNLKTEPVVISGFSFEETHQKVFNSSLEAFKAEVAAMKETCNGQPLNVASALTMSEFARQGRDIVQKAIIDLASNLDDGEVALAISHSPWAELAAVNPETMPYGIGEADTVTYAVEDGKIVASVILPAPIPGKTNT